MAPKVKHCPRTVLPDPSPSLPLPPPLLNIPTSEVHLKTMPSIPQLIAKSVPSALPPIAPPPTKKITPPGPYVKGQVGHIFFSLGRIRSYTDIPSGCSLIINKFWKPFSFEGSAGKYILIDPFENKWSSPETFNKWRECVDHGDLNELDLSKYRLALVRFRSEFKLSSSLRKTSWKDEIYPIHQVDDPQEEEDLREQKDPDFSDELD